MEDCQAISREEIIQAVTTYLKSAEFHLLDYNVGPVSDHIVGFLGDHLRVKISVIVKNDNVADKLDIQLFAKVLPTNIPFHRDYVVSMGAFEKEVMFYSKLLAGLRKHQLTCGDSLWAPECYYTRPDLIILEDLSISDFRCLNIREPLDYHHCVILLRTLARFHASSIIFEEKETQMTGKVCRINQLYPELFQENVFVDSEENLSKGWFLTSIQAIVALTELLPKYGKKCEMHEMIKQKIPEACFRIRELVKTSDKYRNVVCEGDLWTNNILFQYTEEEDVPTQARIVDFQLVRYTPPAHDVILFLYMATMRKFREEYFENLLKVYHDALVSELERHDLHGENLLSWTEFRESCDYLRDVGRIISSTDHQLGIMKSDFIVPNISSEEKLHRFMVVNRNVVVCDSFRSDFVYRKWMTDDLNELIECCILNTDV